MLNDFPVDLVVTYVDNTDPVWQSQISQFNVEIEPKRYRNWDTLKYWFRGVERNMPFIRTVHLVVSNMEQVPKWLDQSKVNVVLHKDIIPERLLPTFNSTTIEMFLCRIPGLSEHFIYSNDDMFAINPMTVDDFFKDGVPIYQLIHRVDSHNVFRMQCKNSYNLAADLSNTRKSRQYFYIKHSMDPMLKSVCEEVHQKGGDRIMRACTKFREPFNYTQYLFPDYGIMTGRGCIGEYSFKYVTLNDIPYALNMLKTSPVKIICLNDSGAVDSFGHGRGMVKRAMDARFPGESRYENTL